MTIEVNRFKGSSHPTKPGGLYIGVVRAVIGIGKITVYVPRLENTFANLSILNAQIDNPVVVGDQVVVGHLDNGTDEMVVFGYLFPKQSVAGDAVTASPLSQFAPTTSAQLASVISNETGTGSLVFANSPALITPTGIVKNDVGLGNVDNTADTAKPVSTAQQTALNLKANLASPTFTGTVSIPSGSSISLPNIDNFRLGYTTTATAGGTTILTNSSNNQQIFTGVTTHTVTMPTASSMTVGTRYLIENNSTGNITVNSSGGNLISTVLPGTSIKVTSILATGTTAASWDAEYVGFNNITGTGSVVMSAAPTFTGIPSAPTAAARTNSTQLATTAFVTAADNLKASLASSPTFSGDGTSSNTSISINAPTGFYPIQYFKVNGTAKWHYEVTPSGGSWSLVETDVAARLTVTSTTTTATGNLTATGVVTGTGGLVSNVFSTGVSYGSYGAVSLLGAGNNGYTGIANSNYACAVMWNATVFGHYRNNNTWNFYFESGTLNNSGNVVSGGNITAVNGGQDGGFTLRPWTASASYVSLASRDMSGSEYAVLTDGTNTFISGGVDGQTHIRAGNNVTSGQVRVWADNVEVKGTFSIPTITVNDTTDYVARRASDGAFFIKSSNRDLKENINPISDALGTINKLLPTSFNWKLTSEDAKDKFSILTKQTHKSMGFILEEVLDVSPELITWRVNQEDGSFYPGYWKIDDFIALSIQGVKELNEKILVLESEIKLLKEQK